MQYSRMTPWSSPVSFPCHHSTAHRRPAVVTHRFVITSVYLYDICPPPTRFGSRKVPSDQYSSRRYLSGTIYRGHSDFQMRCIYVVEKSIRPVFLAFQKKYFIPDSTGYIQQAHVTLRSIRQTICIVCILTQCCLYYKQITQLFHSSVHI